MLFLLMSLRVNTYASTLDTLQELTQWPSTTIATSLYFILIKISASYDTSVRFWDNRSDSYHPIDIIKGFKDSVSQIQCHGAHVLCSSMDGSVRTYDIRRGEVTIDTLS